MNNREIIKQLVAAFDRNDTEAILSYMTDDVTWRMLGDDPLNGKDNMRAMFANADMQLLSSTKDHFIVDGDTVAVDGEVVCKGQNGELMNMYYCDIYDLENGKVKRMTTYAVNKKK